MSEIEILLFTTSSIFLASAGYFHNKIDSVFNRKTKGILFTASVIYSFMGFLYSTNPDTVIRAWRYIDWFITVPLLLTELHLFLSPKIRKNKDLVLAVAFSIIMLSLGLLGELKYLDKIIANLVGSIFGIGVFYVYFKKIQKKHFRFLLTIAALWTFYPIVYVVNDSILTIALFSIVDLSVKVGTAFYISKQEKLI